MQLHPSSRALFLASCSKPLILAPTTRLHGHPFHFPKVSMSCSPVKSPRFSSLCPNTARKASFHQTLLMEQQHPLGNHSSCSAELLSNAETAASDGPADISKETDQATSLAQYVVIRKDLVDSLKWPLGSVITQACHAAVAAVWLHRDHSDTHRYCEDLDNMTTVTLEVKGETQLLNLAQKLQAGGIAYKLWIEQPENFPTCLATKPYPKPDVAHYFKKLKLCK